MYIKRSVADKLQLNNVPTKHKTKIANDTAVQAEEEVVVGLEVDA